MSKKRINRQKPKKPPGHKKARSIAKRALKKAPTPRRKRCDKREQPWAAIESRLLECAEKWIVFANSTFHNLTVSVEQLHRLEAENRTRIDKLGILVKQQADSLADDITDRANHLLLQLQREIDACQKLRQRQDDLSLLAGEVLTRLEAVERWRGTELNGPPRGL